MARGRKGRVAESGYVAIEHLAGKRPWPFVVYVNRGMGNPAGFPIARCPGLGSAFRVASGLILQEHIRNPRSDVDEPLKQWDHAISRIEDLRESIKTVFGMEP